MDRRGHPTGSLWLSLADILEIPPDWIPSRRRFDAKSVHGQG